MFDIGNYLTSDITIELLVSDGFMPGMHLAVKPAFGIDTVDRKDFDLAGIDMRLDHIQKKKSFIFEVVCGSSGYKQQGLSKMAIHCDFHVLIQGRTIPCVQYSFHLFEVICEQLRWENNSIHSIRIEPDTYPFRSPQL